MQELPRLASRRNSAPGESRLRWRTFARFLAAQAVAVLIAAVGLVLAQQKISSTAAAAAAGLVTAFGLSAVSALLWRRVLEHRVLRMLGISEPEAGAEHEHIYEDVSADILQKLRLLEGKCEQKQQEARRSYETLTELMGMMAKAVDERAAYLRGHSERVSEYAEAIARRLDLDEEQVERIRLAGLLHDIGSLGVDDAVMLKETRLTAEEFGILKAHTVKGAAILRPIAMLQDLIPGVELHHEALDGMGYPYGLKGKEIPLMARIVAVADAFDAMTTPRPYQAAMNSHYVLEVMGRLGGTRYDPVVVEALAELVRSGVVVVKDVRVPVSFRMRKRTVELV